MRVRVNKAYLIIGVVAILVLAAMLSGPLIRKRAREKARQAMPQEQTKPVHRPEAKPASPAPAEESP